MTSWNFIGRSQQLSVPAPIGKEIGKKGITPSVFTPDPAIWGVGVNAQWNCRPLTNSIDWPSALGWIPFSNHEEQERRDHFRP
jgi:hypothetical protein